MEEVVGSIPTRSTISLTFNCREHGSSRTIISIFSNLTYDLGSDLARFRRFRLPYGNVRILRRLWFPNRRGAGVRRCAELFSDGE